jgi:hypothetical protein
MNKQQSQYDRLKKMSYYFLLTGSIHYPPKQGMVQERAFSEFFLKMRKEEINLPIKPNRKNNSQTKTGREKSCK